ncbi:uncharacterized protein LOC130220710 [Danio aesculapii]|uniref:uncharacterized protein LOC130220710 n=1 Tax=Danio aesculapii TaxID=1142201 RepID=UPI0024C0918A|nr:uncharacterized protein LOC130220710 [Danio aesculapii]
MSSNNQQRSGGHGKTTLEKHGNDPPDVTLEEIAEDLLSYIGGSPHLKKTEKQIERKYSIEKEDGDHWSADDIKKAWGKTQRMKKTALKRKQWALALLLQLISRKTIKTTTQCDDNNTGNVSQLIVGNTRDQTKAEGEAVRDKASASKLPSSNEKEHKAQKEEGSRKQTVYIRIPLSDMLSNESTSGGKDEGKGKTGNEPTYKLIDRYPKLPHIQKKKSYIILYNPETRNAMCTYEILNRDTLKKRINSSDEKKEKEIDEPKIKQKQNTDSKQEIQGDLNKMTRGHLAKAANHRWCREAYQDANIKNNMAPQHFALNNGIWQELENYCQKKIQKDTENKTRNLHVYSGPLYIYKETKLRSEKPKIWQDKEVPTHFFKVIIEEYDDGRVNMECYKMPNENPNQKTFQDYNVEIEEIEKDSGLKFTGNGCPEGEIDSTRTVKLEGKDADGKPCSAKITVRISTPLADHNQFAYI